MLILHAELITSIVPFINYFVDVITFKISVSIKKKLLHPKNKSRSRYSVRKSKTQVYICDNSVN